MSLARALLVGCCLALLAAPLWASDTVPPRQLFWHVDGDKVVVSNVRFSRTDELQLRARESIEQTASDTAMLVVVTNRRVIGYSVYTASWHSVSRMPGESLEDVQAQDWAGYVLTSRRVLNFNGRTALWSTRNR